MAPQPVGRDEHVLALTLAAMSMLVARTDEFPVAMHRPRVPLTGFTAPW